jgi:uncharacterized OB-fold protein
MNRTRSECPACAEKSNFSISQTGRIVTSSIVSVPSSINWRPFDPSTW